MVGQELQARSPITGSSKSASIEEKVALVRKSFQRPKFWVLGFGWCLAACAGAANTVAFKCWSFYASHVTGSTSAMAFRLEGVHQDEVSGESLREAFFLVFSFLVGAYACGLLIDKNQVHFLGKAFYGLALVLNSSLLILAAFLPGRLLPTCFVAAACGLQNAMCTSHFGAIIRTTHVTGTVTDIGSTLGRISMIYLRKGCRRARLDDVERAEVGVDARKLLVLSGLWTFYFLGGILGIYAENVLHGPRALLVPATATGSLGGFYMAYRQIVEDYVKQLSRESVKSQLTQARDVLGTFPGLHDGTDDEVDVELGPEMQGASGLDSFIHVESETVQGQP